MPLRYWLFVILTLFLTTLVAIATYRSGQLLKRWQPEGNLLLLPSENLVRLGLIAACVALGWLSGLPPEQLGWTLTQWPLMLFEGLLWGIAMAFAIYITTQWIVARSGEQFYSHTVTNALLPRNRKEGYWTFIAMVGVVCAEELLFRSLLLGGLQPLMSPAMLLIVTSIAFGSLHLPQGSWGVAGAAIAGAILGLIFLTTGSIVAPVVAHYVTNMVQIGQAVRMRHKKELSGG